MLERKRHIAQQIKLIRRAKTLVLLLLALSFVLELVLLNLISAYHEQWVSADLSLGQVKNEIHAVTTHVRSEIAEKYKALLDYIKKKHEEQNRHQTKNHQFSVFNLFIVDKFYFQFENNFCLERQFFSAFYQESFTQEVFSDIFHPPQSLSSFQV
ncbi:hypothetical protein [Rhodoflexus sp.]